MKKENLCETCKRSAIMYNARWYPYTGEVRTNAKYQCTLSHKVENKTKCNNYKKELP